MNHVTSTHAHPLRGTSSRRPTRGRMSILRTNGFIQIRFQFLRVCYSTMHVKLAARLKEIWENKRATLRIAETNEFLFPKQFENVGRMAAAETHSASKSPRQNRSDTASFEKFCKSMSWEAHAERRPR
eukprot:scaffold143615_cov47-Cyclotella_meneghiniana.AAC.1